MDFNEMQSINTAPAPNAGAAPPPAEEGMSLGKKIAMAIAVLISTLCIAGGVWYYLDSKKVHIGGNVFNIASASGNFDIDKFTTGYSWQTSHIQNRFLYRAVIVPDGNFTNMRGDIAESYEVSPDGLSYTFKIREGERWSDGTPLTVADVEFSYKALLLSRFLNTNFAVAFAKIKGAEKFRANYLNIAGNYDIIKVAETNVETAERAFNNAKHTLEKAKETQTDIAQAQESFNQAQVNLENNKITLENLNKEFPNIKEQYEEIEKSKPINNDIEGIKVEGNTITITLDTNYQPMLDMFAQVVIYPKHALENEKIYYLPNSNFWRKPITSGMYKYGGSVANKYVSFPRNEYYAGKQPKIDELRYIPSVRPQDLDFYITNDVSQIVNLSSMRDLRRYDVNMLFYRYFVFNIKNPAGAVNEAMNNTTIRQAITYAIDRKKIFYDIYFNTGTVNNSGLLDTHPANNGFVYEYNPERARQLIKESGYDLSRPLRMSLYYTDPLSHHFMNAVKRDLENVGFTVEIIQAPSATFLFTVGTYDFYLKGYGAFLPLEWYNEFGSNNTLNALLGADGAYDQFIEELASATSEEQTNDVLRKLQGLEQLRIEKFPLFTLSQMAYINEARVTVPENIVFGNTFYIYDMQFEDWEIKRK